MSLKKTYARILSYALYEGRPLTTKGRWINGLVFILYRVQSLLPFGKKVVKPIFILGTGRSGTTILGVTLGMHNDVGFLNEPKALWSYLYDKEDLIGSYKRNPGNYRLNEKDVTPGLVRKAHRLFGCYLRFSLSSRLVDKYPELIFRTKFVTSIFPDARFLFLYRNGNDTCHSIQLWSERLGIVKNDESHDWWGLNDRKWKLLCNQIVAYDAELGLYWKDIYQLNNHVDRAAVEWIVTMKEGLRLMAKSPNHIMGVKYEDYVSKSSTREDVLDFCDLASDKRYEKYCNSILKMPKEKAGVELSPLIDDEFHRVMKELGYE